MEVQVINELERVMGSRLIDYHIDNSDPNSPSIVILDFDNGGEIDIYVNDADEEPVLIVEAD